jgi:tetratricopeptide (TPR) repeat protein
VCAAVFGIIAVVAQHSYGGIRQTQLPNFFYNLAIAGYGLVFYLIKMIAPVNLSNLYPYPARTGSLLPFSFYAAGMVSVILITAVIYSARHSRTVAFGSLFFLITILPVLQVIPTGQAMAADRYTYIPSIGLFYLAGACFARLYWRPVPCVRILKNGLLLVAVIGTAALAVLTWQRCQVWKDGITLWSDVIEKYPGEPVAYYNRGLIYKDRAAYDLAIADFTAAIHCNPRFADAYNSRGIAHMKQKHYALALQDYDEALRIKPGYAKVYSNRGLMFYNTAEYEKAIADCTQAIALDPLFATAYYNRANACAAISQDDRARADYAQALLLNPHETGALNNRANLYLKQGLYDQAIADYTTIVNLNPQDTKAYYNRAVAYYKMGDYARAWEDVEKLQAIGYAINQKFLELLQNASHQKATQ